MILKEVQPILQVQLSNFGRDPTRIRGVQLMLEQLQS